MVRVEIDETVRRPIEQVFDRLLDIDGYSEWMPKRALLRTTSQVSPGPVALGATYADKTWLGTVRGEMVAFQRPRVVVFHYTFRLFGARVFEGWPAYRLKPADGGATRVNHTAEGRAFGLFRLLAPIFRRVARGERARTVRALKASLEREPTAAPPRSRRPRSARARRSAG